MFSRNELSMIALETLGIFKTGTYTTCDNVQHDISEKLEAAQKNTILYKPNERPAIPKCPNYETKISIIEETTLFACKTLYNQNLTVCALNFASARNPGGGFLKGASAQEESLARSSGLYSCLLTKPAYYEENKKCKRCYYTENIIVSKDVPVFRDDECNLIDPYYVTFVTAPAVNAGVVLKRGGTEKEVYETMYHRMDRILNCMIGYDAIVLGAFGCGVFKCKIEIVAAIWKKLIETKYKGYWKQIVFAIIGNENFTKFRNVYNSEMYEEYLKFESKIGKNENPENPKKEEKKKMNKKKLRDLKFKKMYFH